MPTFYEWILPVILFPFICGLSSDNLRSASGDKSKKCAVFTVTRNEAIMLPIWIRYYAKYFDFEDMWILDHESTDGSTANLKIPDGLNVTILHGDSSFMPHRFLIKSVERHQSFLLKTLGYGCAIFSETDEIIVADPAIYPGGLENFLVDFIHNKSLTIMRTEGRELIQDESEIPLRWNDNILSQRRFWGISPAFSKTYLSKVPLHYMPGFHHLKHGADPEVNPSLKLLHLHFADTSYCLVREIHKHVESVKMHKEEAGLGAHFSTKFDELQKKPGGVCNASNVLKHFRAEQMSARWNKVPI